MRYFKKFTWGGGGGAQCPPLPWIGLIFVPGLSYGKDMIIQAIILPRFSTLTDQNEVSGQKLKNLKQFLLNTSMQNECAKLHRDSPRSQKVNSISRARSNFRRQPILCTVIAEIFVHDLISPDSMKFSSIRKPCTYNSVSLMRHYPRSTKIYSVHKLANAGVRNFYASENFSDYSTTLHRNPIQASASCHARAFPKTTAVVGGQSSCRKWLGKKQGTYDFPNWRFKVFSTNSKISRSTKPNTTSKTLIKASPWTGNDAVSFFGGAIETCEQNTETGMQKNEKTDGKDEGFFLSIVFNLRAQASFTQRLFFFLRETFTSMSTIFTTREMHSEYLTLCSFLMLIFTGR